MHHRVGKVLWMAAQVVAAGLCLTAHASAAQTVVSDPPRDAADEARAFHLPPGFEAQLVASEPEIHKPINIAFDAKGRLWVTDTVEYPFPAAEGAKTRDTLKILSDFAADGRAAHISTFADTLNIPIGVLPLATRDGRDAAIVYSIPGVWRMADSTGRGTADQRSLLITGQAHQDTHGMTGSFNEGFDGYIYAVHGFKNSSTLHGVDGSQISMTSGHTYRFLPDGSHLQVFTNGQVNPFGMCFDPLGNLYTSDCETMPILMTLRGAYYSSFGMPHDGMGFGPDMTDHMYGSSAIAGLVDYVADQYPPEYRNMMLVGNVVTNKINRAQLRPTGSAFHGDDAPDFLVSDDHWFRPVCLKLGPDGALYVADFYNRIIGHYEVDLHHPGRDKQRGRIWRIVYNGKDAVPAPAQPFDLTGQTDEQIIARLTDGNFTVRMLAMNYLIDARGETVVAPLKAALAKSSAPWLKVHGMWILKRLGALDDAMLGALASDADAAVRVHAMRVLSETANWTGPRHQWALAGLADADPMVQRCAADALGQHPALENVRPLLDALEKAPIADKHLVHMMRLALRNQLNEPGIAEQLPRPDWTPADSARLVDVAAGATSPGATALLVRQMSAVHGALATFANGFRHVGRYGDDAQCDQLSQVAQKQFPGDDVAQLQLFKALLDGVAQRQGKPAEGLRAWGAGLATRLLSQKAQSLAGWTQSPLSPDEAPTRGAWTVEQRRSADGAIAPFLSTLPLGETGTGIIRSAEFSIPTSLTFYIAGHNGAPGKGHTIKNLVRLCDSADHAVLAEAPAPRNDVAQKVTWDLSKFAGRRGYLEAVDADSGTAFAWLSFGRLEPEVAHIPNASTGLPLLTAIDIAGDLKLTDLEPKVSAVLTDQNVDVDTRVAAAKALPRLSATPAAYAATLAGILQDPRNPGLLREAAAAALSQDTSPQTLSAFVEAIRLAAQKQQLSLAKSLAATRPGAAALLDAVAAGKASPRLLQDVNVLERLKVSNPENLDARVAQLTANLPKADVTLQALINDRARNFTAAKASAPHGMQVFQQNCAVCHSIGGVGAHVGPQLDGIGIRGVGRLCEDILDPSRNVDAAFRYNTYQLNSGDVLAGIPRREEGDVITLADSTGKEVQISKATVKRIVPSNLSLMPSNFGEIIKEQDFDDLMAYLLKQVK